MWPQLTATHHCVRYDLRGCGASADRTTAGFRHADDLAALLDGLGISRTALTGASMGGRIAVDFALSYPDRVDRLVLISPGLADWDWSDIWRAHWLELSRTARSGDLERTRDMWFHHPLFATARRDPAMAARLRATIAADACRVWVDADREIPPARMMCRTFASSPRSSRRWFPTFAVWTYRTPGIWHSSKDRRRQQRKSGPSSAVEHPSAEERSVVRVIARSNGCSCGWCFALHWHPSPPPQDYTEAVKPDH
ncbi:alpha/beta fold hydrolase [Nocardia fluminea]|uniref:alpha/beta fold hydrolase n=1 Tax=Nocardia fluminea TaxID=134984 RepID=UPI00341B8ED0